MARVLRAPLVHFLVLGAVLLALRAWCDARGGAAAPSPIVLSADDIGRLREEWTQVHGVAPDAGAEKALVRDALDEEMLYRAALALGIDRADGSVKERLVRLGGFLGEDAGRDRGVLEQEARRLGLERSDLVIRRHLVEVMRLATGRLGPSDLPTEADLQAYLDAHAERFTSPGRVRLTQVYLSRDRRGAAVDADATRLLDELRRTAADPATAPARGDAFIRGAHVDLASRVDLEAIFGPTFARAVDDAPVGTWAGPVPSTYGLHLVWVEERVPATVPTLAVVRNQVLHEVLRERSEQRARERMQALRVQYGVETPGT
jgi:PPIC-type PPIASE domain